MCLRDPAVTACQRVSDQGGSLAQKKKSGSACISKRRTMAAQACSDISRKLCSPPPVPLCSLSLFESPFPPPLLSWHPTLSWPVRMVGGWAYRGRVGQGL